jgi:hypothetical protein
MVARVRDPVDEWGGGQAPMHQMKSACSRHQHREHLGQKRRTYVHDQVGGWGGKEENIPPPTASEVMPRYDPSVAYVRGCPSKNPD